MLNTIDIVRVERREKKAVGEEIRKFLLPISPVQYNKAFVGVRTTFFISFETNSLEKSKLSLETFLCQGTFLELIPQSYPTASY